MDNYKVALSKCNTDVDRAKVCYLFSVFYTIKMTDPDNALEYIVMADKYLPNNDVILLEKVRALTYIGKYDDAEKIWSEVKHNNKYINERTQNIMASRILEIYRRKAELLETRDYKEKYNLIKNGIEHLNEINNVDLKTTLVLLKSLSDLSYLYYYNDAMQLLANSIDKYSHLINKVESLFKAKIIKNLEIHLHEIDIGIYNRIYMNLSKFLIESSKIENENEGVVVKIKIHYGFIANSFHNKDKCIFFSLNNAYNEIRVGDIVRFDLYESSKGIGAKNITFVKRNNNY